MKSLLEFKKELITVTLPIPELGEGFKRVCDLLESWGIDISSVKVSTYSCNPIRDDFEELFIKEFILRSLGVNLESPIWNDIFYIKKSIWTYGHGSRQATSYEFILKPKDRVVKDLSGDYVYANYKSIEDFMRRDNESYNRLLEISKVFGKVINYD